MMPKVLLHCALSIGLVVAVAAATDTAPAPRPKVATANPRCVIVELSRKERFRRINAPPNPKLLALGHNFLPQPRYPEGESNNPILYAGKYCVVVFENTTAWDVVMYGLRPWKEPELRDAQDAFIVDIDVHDGKNALIKPSFNPFISMSDSKVPPAKELKEQEAPFFVTVKPGEKVELPCWLTGRLLPNDIKPGVHQTIAKVSYALAPSGEKRIIESAPYKFTVTKKHIEAADEFWEKVKASRSKVKP